MRPKQLRNVDRDGFIVPSGSAVVSDGTGAQWSRGRVLLPIIADGRLTITSGDSVPAETSNTVLYYTYPC